MKSLECVPFVRFLCFMDNRKGNATQGHNLNVLQMLSHCVVEVEVVKLLC